MWFAGSVKPGVPVAAGSSAVREPGLLAAVQPGTGSSGRGAQGGAYPPHPVGSPAAGHAGGCSSRE